MSIEQVSTTVRAYLDALLARADFARFYSEEVTFGVPAADWSTSGREAVERAIRHHYEIEFDSRPEVVNLLAGEGGAAAELIFAGTNIGAYDGAPPTGHAIRVPISMFVDVEDGQITAIRVYYSRDQLTEQVRNGIPDA
jgi:steroid delta-isomerase-like uncharacterized protein